jgi:hypothetical protein
MNIHSVIFVISAPFFGRLREGDILIAAQVNGIGESGPFLGVINERFVNQKFYRRRTV